MNVILVLLWAHVLSTTATSKPVSKRGARIIKGGTKHERQMRHGSDYIMAGTFMVGEHRYRNQLVTKHQYRDFFLSSNPRLASQRREVEAFVLDDDEDLVNDYYELNVL